MKTGGTLPTRWKTAEHTEHYLGSISSVLDTPPISPRSDGLVLFSLLGTGQVLPFLLAVKSLWVRLRRGRVVVMDDGTLTAQDRAILAHHCGDPLFTPGAFVNRGPFPRGMGWEQLLAILDERQRDYWIALSSDTLTLGDLPEVEQALERNRSFITVGEDGLALPLRRAGLAGFSALGSGRHLSSAILAEYGQGVTAEALDVAQSDELLRAVQRATDPGAILLGTRRFHRLDGGEWNEEAAFIHAPTLSGHEQSAYLEASVAVIKRLTAMLR